MCLNEQMPDIFGLCETFLNDKIPDRMLCHKNYTIERKDRSGKSGGGIICYVQDDLAYKRRTDLETQSLEIIWLEIVYSTSKNILVGFLYRPPNSQANWLTTFNEHLEKVHDEGKEIIIMGDMNIDLMNCVKETAQVMLNNF